MAFDLKVTPEEVLLGKFANTIKVMEGYKQAAEDDKEEEREYDADTVWNRIDDIAIAFYADLKKMAGDVKIDMK